MTSPELVVTLAALALAGFAQGMFGLGFAMIATPLLALFLDYASAVFLAAVPLLVLSTGWLLRHRGVLFGSGVPIALLPAIGAGAAAGTLIQSALSQAASLLLLAALLVFSALVPLLARRWDPAGRGITRAPMFGVLAGTTESALNVGAPFMVLYGGMARLTRLQQLIALNMCFCVGKSIQLSLILAAASAPVQAVPLLVAVAVSLVFFLAGDRLAGRYSEETFRRLMRGFLVCMAAVLVVRVATM